MSNIITCQCGAQVRLPENRGSRSFRCPQCKAGIALTVEARVLVTHTLKPGDGNAICPICQTGIATEEECVECPQCQQIHHHECWSEIGGCGTYGCQEAPVAEKKEPTAQARSAWGDTKTCPACGEVIKSIALKCRYCETEFGTVDPLTRADLRKQAIRDKELESYQQSIVALFVFSLLGCPAPITLLVGLRLIVPQEQRKRLSKCGPVHQVLGWASLGLSAFYTVLIVAFVLIEALA